MIEQTIATTDYPAGTLHHTTTSIAGYPIHWYKTPGQPWVAENMNTPAPGGDPWNGPGLYDAAKGPGGQYSIHPN
jgi:hypothetical protein